MLTIRKWTKLLRHTICPRSLATFYIVSYNIKWVNNSWTYSYAALKASPLSNIANMLQWARLPPPLPPRLNLSDFIPKYAPWPWLGQGEIQRVFVDVLKECPYMSAYF